MLSCSCWSSYFPVLISLLQQLLRALPRTLRWDSNCNDSTTKRRMSLESRVVSVSCPPVARLPSGTNTAQSPNNTSKPQAHPCPDFNCNPETYADLDPSLGLGIYSDLVSDRPTALGPSTCSSSTPYASSPCPGRTSPSDTVPNHSCQRSRGTSPLLRHCYPSTLL